jgi:hypothetical protein
MKRSGNHALATWLRAQADFVYFNNVLPMRPVLWHGMRIPEPMSPDAFMRWQLRKARKRSGGFAPVAWTQWRLRHKPVLAGLEDHPPGLRLLATTVGVTHLLIVRDVENMLASRIRKAFRIGANPAYPREPGLLFDRVVANWKAHARELLGETNLLPNKVCAEFATWVASRAYRAAIAAQLGLVFDDRGHPRVSEIGGGSSFDGMRFDGASGEMRLLRRAEQLEGPERALLEGVLADPELPALSRALDAHRRALAARYAESSQT